MKTAILKIVGPFVSAFNKSPNTCPVDSEQVVKAILDIPIPMLMWCPECGERHVDIGEFATKPHHTHACQHCGHCWRPAIGATIGVQFLPGFKNEGGT